MNLKYQKFIRLNGLSDDQIPVKLKSTITKLDALAEAYEGEHEELTLIKELDAKIYNNLKAAFPLKEGLLEDLTPAQLAKHNEAVLSRFEGKATSPLELQAAGYIGTAKPGLYFGGYKIQLTSRAAAKKLKVVKREL